MKTARTNKTKYSAVAAILFAVLLIVSSFIGSGAQFARAAVSPYSSALADLQKDKNFDVAAYPRVSGDYSLQVIQIAESTDGELFIYVYQPIGTTRVYAATTVNISTTVKEDLQYDNYGLELLSSIGTLNKYKVKDFEVKTDDVRYYDISAIYRKWSNSVDGVPDNDNTASEKAYAVGQLWTAQTAADGKVTYACKDVEVLDVTKQFVHFIRFGSDFEMDGLKSKDSHFFAFSCDHAIDALVSADLHFCTTDYKQMEGQSVGLIEDTKQEHFVTVDYTTPGPNPTQTWQRLTSTATYLQERDVPEDEAERIKGYDWIINFYETDYKRDFGGKDILYTLLIPGGFIWAIVDACTLYGTIVTDVTLMRLEFEYAGDVYNLGVVSDKQTGDVNAPGENCGNCNFLGSLPWWAYLIIICFAPVALVLLVFFIKWLFVFLFVTLPKRRKERKAAARTKPKQKSKSKRKKAGKSK